MPQFDNKDLKKICLNGLMNPFNSYVYIPVFGEFSISVFFFSSTPLEEILSSDIPKKDLKSEVMNPKQTDGNIRNKQRPGQYTT